MRLITIIIVLFSSNSAFAQEGLISKCLELETAAFVEELDRDNIEKSFKEFNSVLNMSTINDLAVCDCADSLWIMLLVDNRNFRELPYDIRNPHSYLRQLVTRVEKEYLKRELHQMALIDSIDSLKHVISRLKTKDERRSLNEDEWMEFYHCIEAEVQYLKDHRFELKNKYFKYIDDSTMQNSYKDILLSSMYHMGYDIETEILNRIGQRKYKSYYNRMCGVLATSGKDRSVNFFLNTLQNETLDLNNIKKNLHYIYSIIDHSVVKRRTKNKFKKYLKTSQLDTLSRYEILIRY